MSFSVISSHNIEEALEAFGRHFVSFTLKSGYVRLLKAWEGRWRKNMFIRHLIIRKIGEMIQFDDPFIFMVLTFQEFSYVMYIPIYWIF